MKILKALILIFVCCTKCTAQSIDLDFLIKKIKADYPAYSTKTNNRDFNELIHNVLKNNKSDSFKAMSEIVAFFKDRHLDLFKAGEPINKAECERNFKYVKEYFSSPVKKKKFEGYWLSEHNHCIIAIKRVDDKHVMYKGYIVESRDSQKLPPGLEYYDFYPRNKFVFFTKGTTSGSRSKFYITSTFRNDSLMTAGPYHKWKKLNSHTFPMLPNLTESTDSASGRWLDRSTFLIAIPASTSFNGDIVDSLVSSITYDSSRLKTLIIDLRQNTGGTTRAFTPLWSLVYTNPIIKPRAALYCTEDEIGRTQERIKEYMQRDDLDSSDLRDLKQLLQIEKDSIGKFIEPEQDTIRFERTLSYPKNIGIIIDYSCQSAAELMLLTAKQSKKVKLFGEHTMGAVDYLDFYSMELPSKKYTLYIPSTRRIIPPKESKIDGIGIYPDVEIHDNEKDWVEFVRKYYEHEK